MAKKKMEGWKVAVIALAAVIGLGSIVAFSKDEEKEEEAHVHDYGLSLVCECGERKQEVLIDEIEAGMNLAGYEFTLAVSEDEFNEYLTANDGFVEDCFFINFEQSVDVAGIPTNSYITCGLNDVQIFLYETEECNALPLYDWNGGIVTMMNIFTVTEALGPITSVTSSKSAKYFKFVYVGETSSASAVSYKVAPATVAETETVEQNETESADGYEVVNDLPAPDEEWSLFY